MKKILILLLLLSFISPSKCFAVAADLLVTVAGAGTKAGDTWANAMGLAEWETDCEASAEAGDRYFIAGGTYTLTANFDCQNDGTSALPIQVLGVDSGTTNEPPVFSDWATGANRPLIAAAGNDWTFDNGWVIRNIRLTTTDTSGFECGISCTVENCSSNNSSGAAARNAFTAGSISLFINNEMQSILGDCTDGNFNSGRRFFYNYCHDSNRGFSFTNSSRMKIIGNIFDTITTIAINIEDVVNNSDIVGNTIYNVATALDLEASESTLVYNNIFDTCSVVGITQDSAFLSNIFDYNNYSNGCGVTNVTQGPNKTELDPQFTNAPDGDFSIGTNLKAKGFPGTFPGGLSEGFLDIGAVQREEAGAGGGASAFTFVQ